MLGANEFNTSQFTSDALMLAIWEFDDTSTPLLSILQDSEEP